MLETGTKAPDFELPDQNGKIHKLSDYVGKKVILYFYPKDNTPGCTKQACGFSERYPQFMQKGAVILGVSKDSVSSHKKFEEKNSLAFTLLSDPERMFGKKKRIMEKFQWELSEQHILLTNRESLSRQMIKSKRQKTLKICFSRYDINIPKYIFPHTRQHHLHCSFLLFRRQLPLLVK